MTMYCQNCGQETSSGAKFCAKCGRPLAATPAPAPTPASAPPTPQPVAKRKRPSWIIMIGGSFLVLLALLAVIGGIVVQFQESDTPAASAGASASATATDTSSTSASDGAAMSEASDAPAVAPVTINSLTDFRHYLPGTWCALIKMPGNPMESATIRKYVIDKAGRHYKEYSKNPSDAAFDTSPGYVMSGTITYTTERYTDTGTRYFMASFENSFDGGLSADPGAAEDGTVTAWMGVLSGTASHDCAQYE